MRLCGVSAFILVLPASLKRDPHVACQSHWYFSGLCNVVNRGKEILDKQEQEKKKKKEKKNRNIVG